jgi:hypothetical protein
MFQRIENLRLQEVANDIVAVVDGFCSQEHANGPACHWGGALLRLGIHVAQHAETMKSKEFMGQGMTMGGTGPKSKVNTRLAYLGMLPTSSQDDPLVNVNFRYFDEPLFKWIQGKVERFEPVPTTKCRHDYALVFEEIIYIVGEALSVSLDDELVKIIVALVKILCYSDVAWGIISTATYIIIIRARIVRGTVVYGKAYVPFFNNSKGKVLGAEDLKRRKDCYEIQMTTLIDIFARIALEMQINMKSMIERQQRIPQDHPYTGREGHTQQCVRAHDCVLYMGNDKSVLDNLPKDYFPKMTKLAAEKGFAP